MLLTYSILSEHAAYRPSWATVLAAIAALISLLSSVGAALTARRQVKNARQLTKKELRYQIPWEERGVVKEPVGAPEIFGEVRRLRELSLYAYSADARIREAVDRWLDALESLGKQERGPQREDKMVRVIGDAVAMRAPGSFHRVGGVQIEQLHRP